MTREEVIKRLRPFEAELRRAGLAALYLFGSTARNEASQSSDVDLAFDLGNAPEFDLVTQAGLQIRLAEVLGTHVDLVDRKCLRPRVRARVEADLTPVFQ